MLIQPLISGVTVIIECLSVLWLAPLIEWWLKRLVRLDKRLGCQLPYTSNRLKLPKK